MNYKIRDTCVAHRTLCNARCKLKGVVTLVENKQGGNAFVVKIVSQENGTWQGTITWLNANETQPFRSALEMIKLIDGANCKSKD